MKKIHKEDWIYIFLLLSPVLDICSSIFNFGHFSISLFLRPLIPFCLLVFIFITDKKVRKYLLIGGLIYLGFGFAHLFVYQKLITDFSYGGLVYEMSYLCNYTYLIFTLFLFLYLFGFRKENDKLKRCFLIYVVFYIVSIYFAIITGTSFTTYVEKTGYRGWFHTGGAVGSILIGSLFILLPYILKDKKHLLWKMLFLFLIIFYLTFLLGTRVGLLGSIVVLVCYFVFQVVYRIFHATKLNKRFVILGICLFTLLVSGVVFVGSESLNRRKEIDKLTGKVPDGSSEEVIYMAYDLVKLKREIDSNAVKETYMLEEQKQAIIKLDDYTKTKRTASTDLRRQQLMYHHFLWQEQKDIGLKLVGNGYLTNMGMLTLEMEIIALFYNFGIVGFLLFIGPFFILFGYGVYQGMKHFKKVDVSYMMLVAGCFMTYAISIMAGHTYFNSSVMIVIILLHTLLFQKANLLRKGEFL